ncbi:unnamed protein product [Urochloa decumbens]|uniref:F-box domain-containing protein n=1 Tax=Urochloa decumbens TaxID=240449 RepID=A0ABC9GCI6_9POAL
MEPRPRQRRRTTVDEEEPTTTTAIYDVPDDLLWQILLRLDSPLWLVRAACASKPLRRAIITGGRAFLRLAASLHPPVVVGHYHECYVRPTEFVPSSPPPPIDGSRFSLDFLPRHVTNWEVADCHGGLVLLHDYFGSLQGLIICDPLTRRYQGIPHPPEKRPGFSFSLLDGGDDGDGISISNFRVLYRFQRAPHICVFSSTAGGSGEWRFLRQSADHGGDYIGHVAGRIDGSLCLGLATGNVKVLDNASLLPSEVDLPIRIDTSRSLHRSAFTVVHGAGRDPTSPAATWIVHVYGEELEFFRQVRGGEWVLEHSIPKLSEAARGLLGCQERRLEWAVANVIAVGTGIAVLQARDRVGRMWVFSVDMDTKELKVVPDEDYRRTRRTFTYTLPWRHFLRACPC